MYVHMGITDEVGTQKKVNCRNSWPLTIACHMKNLRKISSRKGICHPAPFCFLFCSFLLLFLFYPFAETKIHCPGGPSQTTYDRFYYVKTTPGGGKPFTVAGFAGFCT